MGNLPAATVLIPFALAGEEGRRSVHKHDLPGDSLDIKSEPVITKQGTPLWRYGAWSQCCSPHTSLMAICGHYSPPMTHTHTLECSLCPSRAGAVGFSTTLPPLLLLLLTAAVNIDVYSPILAPQTHYTAPPAYLMSCNTLFICQQDW